MKKVLSFLATGLIMASVLVAGSAHAFAASPSGHAIGQHVRSGDTSTVDGRLDLYAIDAVYGKPIAGAAVTISDANGNVFPALTSGTNSEGYFGANLPGGDYKIMVTKADYSNFVTSFTAGVGSTTPIKAVLMPTSPVPGPMPQPQPDPDPDPAPCPGCVGF